MEFVVESRPFCVGNTAYYLVRSGIFRNLGTFLQDVEVLVELFSARKVPDIP